MKFCMVEELKPLKLPNSDYRGDASFVDLCWLSATASVAGALYMLYPNLAGQFGSSLIIGTKADFPAARPSDFRIGQAGVFYHQEAKTYVAHLAKDTQFSL